MKNFKVGDKVRVEFVGIVTEDSSGGDYVISHDAVGYKSFFHQNIMTLVAPALPTTPGSVVYHPVSNHTYFLTTGKLGWVSDNGVSHCDPTGGTIVLDAGNN